METLESIFSTREIALFSWVLICFLPFLISKKVREASIIVVKALLSKHILRAFSALLVYVVLIAFLLYQTGFWDPSLLKDSIFWFFTVAVVTFFSINRAKGTGYFLTIMKDNFKWMILLEFIINFYTFDLWIEMILVPFIFFISIMSAFSSTKAEYEPVQKLTNTILSIFGLVIFLYVVYKTITAYQEAFTFQNLKALVLPFLMTVLFIPFAYLLALFVIYEQLFIRVNFLAHQGIPVRAVKQRIMVRANLNINRLIRIVKDLHEFVRTEGFTANY